MLFVFLTITAIFLIYNQKYKYGFLIHLFIITQGFRFWMTPQIQVFGFGLQPHDLSILFLIFAYNEYLFRNNLNLLKKYFNESFFLKIFKWFVLLILIEAVIDYCFNMVSVTDIIIANRKWVTLAVLPLYHYLKEQEIKWIIKSIVIITFIQILIVPLQPVLGFEIPGSMRSDGFGGMRYALMPYFWFLAFWYVYFTDQLKTNQKAILLITVAFVLFFSGSRKNFLAIILTILFFYSLRLSIKNTITSVVLILLFGLLILKFSHPGRIDNFRADILKISKTNLNTYIHNSREGGYGTAAFRYYIFLERYQYLKKYPRKLLFGYGFIHETNLQRNPFSITVDNTYALDIGDISWAYLLVRYGLFGMAMMGFIIFSGIRFFIKHLNRDPFLFKVGLNYLVSVFVLSFGDNFLISPIVFTIPYMISLIANPVSCNASIQNQPRILISN